MDGDVGLTGTYLVGLSLYGLFPTDSGPHIAQTPPRCNQYLLAVVHPYITDGTPTQQVV